MSIFKFGSCLAVALLNYSTPNFNPQRILPCNKRDQWSGFRLTLNTKLLN